MCGRGVMRLDAPVTIPVGNVEIRGKGGDATTLRCGEGGKKSGPLVMVGREGRHVVLQDLCLDTGVSGGSPVYLLPETEVKLRRVRTTARGDGVLAAYTVEAGARLEVEECDFREMLTDHVAFIRPVGPKSERPPGVFVDNGGNAFRNRGELVAGGKAVVESGTSTMGSGGSSSKRVASGAGGVVWDVSDVAELVFAMSKYGDGDEIVLGSGVYEVEDTLDAGDGICVTIRGSRGSRAVIRRSMAAGTHGDYPFVMVDAGATVVLENLVVDGGPGSGPAFVIDSGSNTVVLDCVEAVNFQGDALGLGVVGAGATMEVKGSFDFVAFGAPALAHLSVPDVEEDLPSGALVLGPGKFRGRPPPVMGDTSRYDPSGASDTAEEPGVWDVFPEGTGPSSLAGALEQYSHGDVIRVAGGRYVVNAELVFERGISVEVEALGRVVLVRGVGNHDAMLSVGVGGEVMMMATGSGAGCGFVIDNGKTARSPVYVGSEARLHVEDLVVTGVVDNYCATVEAGGSLVLTRPDFRDYGSPFLAYLHQGAVDGRVDVVDAVGVVPRSSM